MSCLLPRFQFFPSINCIYGQYPLCCWSYFIDFTSGLHRQPCKTQRAGALPKTRTIMVDRILSLKSFTIILVHVYRVFDQPSSSGTFVLWGFISHLQVRMSFLSLKLDNSSIFPYFGHPIVQKGTMSSLFGPKCF